MHIKRRKGECKLKVAFWSNFHGQNATTSNMLATSIMAVLLHNSKVFLGQSHFQLNNLENPLLVVSSGDRNAYFMNVGIDALVRAIKSTYLDEEIIENSTLSYMNKKLILLPSTVKKSQRIYEENLDKTIVSILEASSKYHDLVIMDTNSRQNKITDKIIDATDLIVINLSQNLRVLNDYEENYLDKFQGKNVIYVLGNYNPDSRYNLKNLKKTYSWLKSKNVGLIPYNTEFMDSMSDGKIIPFFYANIMCDKHDSNYYFIQEVKKTTNLIQSIRNKGGD